MREGLSKMVGEDCSLEDQVENLGTKVVQCLLRADTRQLADCLDEGFVLRLPDGERMHKDEWLRLLSSGVARYDALTVQHSAIHLYDGQVAFLSGYFDLRKTYRGQGIAGRFPFTALYVCKHGMWKLVALHQMDRGEHFTSATM